MKRVRMLTDWTVEKLDYRCGQVVELPDAAAKELVNLGAADANAKAVAFGLEESGGRVLVHKTEAMRAAEVAVAQAEAELAGAVAKLEGETDAALRAATEEACAAAKKKLDEAYALRKAARE